MDPRIERNQEWHDFWGPMEEFENQELLARTRRRADAFNAIDQEIAMRKKREKRNEQLAGLGGLGATLAAVVGGNMYANRKWLTRAVQNNDLKTVKKLLKEGADVNTKEMGPMGLTVTQRAAVEGFEKVFDELMKHKPDLNVKVSGDDIHRMMKNNLDHFDEVGVDPYYRKTYNAMKRIQTKLNKHKSKKSGFGKKRKTVKRSRKTVKRRKVVKRPSKYLRDQAKRHKVKLTIKRDNKRVYKSEKVLRDQIKRKMK